MQRLFVLGCLAMAGCAHVRNASSALEIERAVSQRIAELDSGLVAVSFIDLANNQEFHISGDVSMHAASTMKVPVLLELYRQADAHEIALDSLIVVNNVFQSIADTSHYKLDASDDSDSLVYTWIGQRKSIRELARHMIVRSSNLATNILIDLVKPARVRATVASIGATGVNVQRGVEDIPAFRKGMNNTTTSRGLALVLADIARCGHASRRACEEMIAVLSAQEFNEMIPAGLPKGTRVAHKTGWITGIQHDGAIVFPPNRKPYVLVVLTKGIMDTTKAAQTGAAISRIVWDRVH
ncbi:MAG TPA: serine hydrolase [Longimicrobiales bacterium]|nr:serine hydrolase [Longimicrobiales bacterium]